MSTLIILPRVSLTGKTNKKQNSPTILLCPSEMLPFKVYSPKNVDMVGNIRGITETNPSLCYAAALPVLFIPSHLVLPLHLHLCLPSSTSLPFQTPQPPIQQQVSSFPFTGFIHPPIKLPCPCKNE